MNRVLLTYEYAGSATFNGSSAQTFTVTSNASSSNGASTIVARDSSGNFAANTITANLTGTASNATYATTAGSATSATTATTATNATQIINAGSFNITVSGTNLLFSYNGTTVASLDSSGNFTTIANITAYGTL